MNDTFVDLYGYDPLTASEIDALAKQYLPVIDPRFLKAATVNGEVIAFMLGIPNMSEGFRRAKGHLFPVGFLRILGSARKSKQLDLLIGGVKRDYRGQGLDLLGMSLLIQEARRGGFRWMTATANWRRTTRCGQSWSGWEGICTSGFVFFRSRWQENSVFGGCQRR